jgi:hypothetical protein
MTEHPQDDLAAFALGALDEPERGFVDAHVRICVPCTEEVETYRVALHSYASAADVAPSDLRSRIVARASSGAPNGRSRDNAWTAWLRRPIALVPVALAVVILVSIATVLARPSDADRYASTIANIRDARILELSTTNSVSDLQGSLVIPREGAPYVVLRVHAPPSGRAWEAWVLHANTPLPAGLSASGGVVTITLTAPLAAGDGVAVTQEPSAGSAAPTSDPVLVVPRT